MCNCLVAFPTFFFSSLLFLSFFFGVCFMLPTEDWMMFTVFFSSCQCSLRSQIVIGCVSFFLIGPFLKKIFIQPETVLGRIRV